MTTTRKPKLRKDGKPDMRCGTEKERMLMSGMKEKDADEMVSSFKEHRKKGRV